MKIDESNKRLYVRQSWLGDVAICPERARLGQVRPDLRTGSDATVIGTSLHAGIEAVLTGAANDRQQMFDAVQHEWNSLQDSNYKVTNIDQSKIQTYLESMTYGFYDEILPSVPQGGLVEHFFTAPLNMEVNGYGVYLEGTMDYVAPDGTIWDWKTSSRTYNIKDKQKSAIQPTVYAAAAVHNGLVPDYPVQFRYGVMVRQETPKTQIATVERTEKHGLWLNRLVRSAVTSAMAIGMDNNWLINDSSTLCSEAWCSYWSICKGAFCGDDEARFANQSLTD